MKKKAYVAPECLEIGKMLKLTQQGHTGGTYDGVYTDPTEDPDFDPDSSYGS